MPNFCLEMNDKIVIQSLFGKFAKRLWKLICISPTILTTLWQLNEYCNGPVRTIVEYKRFNDEEIDVHPSVGVCFTNTLLEENLKKYGEDVNSSVYYDFLEGEMWNPDLLRIEYSRVTQNLEEYIQSYEYKTRNGKIQNIYAAGKGTDGRSESKPGFKLHSFLGMKCFTIDFPRTTNHQVYGYHVHLRTDIFNGGKRIDNPGEDYHENQFMVILHYPNQLITHMDLAKRRWPTRKSNAPKNHVMAFDVLSVDVVEKISTRVSPCKEGNRDYDTEERQSLMNRLGCKPPYWNSSSSSPLCTSQDKLKIASENIFATLLGYNKHAIRPCRRFENIVYTYEDIETPAGWDNSSLIMIFDYSTPHYKELKGVKNMELQTLIGK